MDKPILTKEEKLSTPYKVKANDAVTVMDIDTTKKIVTGIYNTYNYLDCDCDVLLPGCALKSINERGPKSTSGPKIKHALFHDLTKLPGKILTLEEKEVEIENKKVFGLYFETQMSQTQDGIDTLIKYQEGIYDNHSIGFRYLQLEYINAEAENWMQLVASLSNPDEALECGMMWLVKEINLFEGSTVAFGANDLTPYLGVKSKDKKLIQMSLFEKMDRINNQLKNGKSSDESMQIFELQMLQIKQMIKELLESEPFDKSTLIKPDTAKSPAQKLYSFDELINGIKN